MAYLSTWHPSNNPTVMICAGEKCCSSGWRCRMKAVALSSALTPAVCGAGPWCPKGCNQMLAVFSAEVCLPQLRARAWGSVPAELLSRWEQPACAHREGAVVGECRVLSAQTHYSWGRTVGYCLRFRLNEPCWQGLSCLVLPCPELYPNGAVSCRPDLCQPNRAVWRGLRSVVPVSVWVVLHMMLGPGRSK